MFACFTNNNGHIHQSIHFLRLKPTIDKVPKSLLNHLNKEEVATWQLETSKRRGVNQCKLYSCSSEQ